MDCSMAEEDLDGMDPFVISLVEESRKISGIAIHNKSGIDQMSAWIDVQERVEGRSKVNGSRRLSIPKEHRSVTPRRMMSRQQCNVRNEIDFRHYPDSGKYIEDYRNAKLQKQEAVLRAVLSKNDRRRSSDSGLSCSQSDQQSEKTVGHLPQHVERKPSPLIVITSKGSSRPCNLPLEGHFQGRKLQCRPQILPRTTYVHRESLWHQSGTGTTTTKMIPLDSDSSHVNSAIHDQPAACGANKHPFSVSTKKRVVQCTSAKSTKSNISASMTRQTSPSQLSTNISAAIEKCDYWVKNRDQALDSVQVKDKLCRSYSASDATRVSSRASSSKGQLDSTKNEAASANANHASSPKPSSNIDYSHYTDMFKNVLEYYGPKRLRPKSNVSLDHHMVSLKS